jgi:hypothetical protein
VRVRQERIRRSDPIEVPLIQEAAVPQERLRPDGFELHAGAAGERVKDVVMNNPIQAAYAALDEASGLAPTASS